MTHEEDRVKALEAQLNITREAFALVLSAFSTINAALAGVGWDRVGDTDKETVSKAVDAAQQQIDMAVELIGKAKDHG